MTVLIEYVAKLTWTDPVTGKFNDAKLCHVNHTIETDNLETIKFDWHAVEKVLRHD